MRGLEMYAICRRADVNDWNDSKERETTTGDRHNNGVKDRESDEAVGKIKPVRNETIFLWERQWPSNIIV
jgi:hypothetical protein